MDIPEKRMREGLSYASKAGFTASEISEIESYITFLNSDASYVLTFLEAYGAYTSENSCSLRGEEFEFERRVPRPGLFNLVLFLSMIPCMKELFESKGYTERMFISGLRDLKIWSDWTRENYGESGIDRRGGFNWILYQFNGLVLRFGRLQCNLPGAFFDDVLVLRNRVSGEIVTLLDSERGYLADGLSALESDLASFRTSRAVFTSDSVSGFVCSRDGRVKRDRFTFDFADWEISVRGDDKVLNLHIPADGAMPWSECVESMKMMYDFFGGVNVKAFICETWFLDPSFGGVLPPGSNIADYQRHVHIFPYPGAADTLRRVFGVKAVAEGIDSVPHNSSLRRALASFIHSGGVFRNGAMVLLPEEII